MSDLKLLKTSLLSTEASTDTYLLTRKVFPHSRHFAKLGRSSRAIVEFAPYHRYVRGKPKQDPRQGTIESSLEYKEFLESLSQPTAEPTPLETVEEPTTTPLIEFIRARKVARQEKEKVRQDKVRVAKIAAVQAKADAQSAKIRSEKLLDKSDVGPAKEEVASLGKSAARGGRGGGSKTKERDKAQHARVVEKRVHVEDKSPAAIISPSTPATGAAEGVPFRGRGGRGRSRPQGVYRGRSGGRGRGGSVSEGQPIPNTANG